MSNQLRKIGRGIMRRHKALPSKRKRAGLPFKQWTKIVIQMIEARKKAAMEAHAKANKPKSIAEQLKAGEEK